MVYCALVKVLQFDGGGAEARPHSDVHNPIQQGVQADDPPHQRPDVYAERQLRLKPAVLEVIRLFPGRCFIGSCLLLLGKEKDCDIAKAFFHFHNDLAIKIAGLRVHPTVRAEAADPGDLLL